MKRLASALLIALAVATAPAVVHAQTETAKEAYEEGTRAHKAGDFARAASAFARADALSPNDVALKAALDAAVKADDPVLGGELLDRARRRTLGATAQASVAAAEAKLAHRTGFVRVLCSPPCSATIDGKDATPGTDVRTTLGQHIIVAKLGNAPDSTATTMVTADQTATVLFDPPAPPPTTTASTPPPPPPSNVTPPDAPPVEMQPPPDTTPPSGITPVVFFVGLGVTAILGGATLASGLDTKSTHDSFVGARCAVTTSKACNDLADDGAAAQLRTNVLGAVTGAAGVATLVIGIFFTRWRTAPVRVAPATNGLGFSVSGTF